MQTAKLIAWLSEVDREDVELVGGKGANLGEMLKKGFNVPNGFVVTTDAYFEFVKENNLSNKIKHFLNNIDYNSTDSLSKISKLIKQEIAGGKLSSQLTKKILLFYSNLCGSLNDCFVAVRSSSNFEDLSNASFAGQQESYLNVKGDANLIIKIKDVWASLFNARAIFYRHENKLDHFRLGIAVCVQKMVNSKKSGVMFTIDPVSMDSSKIIIEAVYGLGELIVKGEVTPDHYKISKENLSVIYRSVKEQSVWLKKVRGQNKIVSVPKIQKKVQKINDDQIIRLAQIGKDLENYYKHPQDIEWAVEQNKIYIVQTRPVTTIQNRKLKIENRSNSQLPALPAGRSTLNSQLLVKGDPASPGMAAGRVRVIKNAKEIKNVTRGEVMVAAETNPDFVPGMKKAVAMVTDRGGRTSHAAIVSREIGIPAVVGTKNATKILKEGMIVTVNGTTGEIYKGFHVSHSKAISNTSFKHINTATKVYVNLSDPARADQAALSDADGVGLLRAEFIIAQIGTHPKKLIRDGKGNVFITELADSLEKFTRAFGDRPVVYRTSDLKTNEYRNLIGGKQFEPHEENPMIGFRGALRYINDPELFNLELEAVKRVRHIRGNKNLWIMIPFVRTIKELIMVKKLISNAGLYRSESFKIWMMVEIPSNVILLEKFIETGIDGVSIGSNDLTQLILGIDRDNGEIAREFDEQNEAVLWAIEKTIKTCNKYKITSSVCGQAVSIYPTLVKKLVKWGVSSISVSPDAIGNTKQLISDFEKWQK